MSEAADRILDEAMTFEPSARTAYVEQWSFRLDLKIMVKTIGVMISGEGAY